MLKKNKLIEDLIKLNIKPILVGGIVRDYLMNPNLESKDIDIEMDTTKNYEKSFRQIPSHARSRICQAKETSSTPAGNENAKNRCLYF